MARFCGTCGNALQENSAFCGACGAPVLQAGVPLTPPVSPLPPASPLPPVKSGSSPIVKIILVVVLLLVVLGAISVAGIFYAVHLASRKAHEFSRQVRDAGLLSSLPAGSDTASGSDGSVGTLGPGACRFLNKEDVGRAIGVAIVATRTTVGGCEYLAQGTASKGATAQQQQAFQSLAHGLLGSAQRQADGSGAPINTVVMTFTIDPNAAKTRMSMDDSVGPGAKHIDGIGDDALDASGSVLMLRKGNQLIRITYSTCPCTIDAIKPLTQELAASL
jgi:hypothetical protein